MSSDKDRRSALAVERPRSFTLIELLVVMGIVALLVAILFPSLSAARRSSKQSVCLTNLKSIASAALMYAADDQHGWGIPLHPLYYVRPRDPIGAYEWGGKSGIGDPGFVDGPADGPEAWVTSKYGTKAGFGPSTRPMNDLLYPGGFKDNLHPSFDRLGAKQDTRLDLQLYRCPADDGPPRGAHCPDWVGHSERSSYDHFGTSYSANKFMISFLEGGLVLSNSPYLRPLSRVPNPSRTLYYEENIGRWAWACRREIDDCLWLGPGVDPGPTKAVRGWHGPDWTYSRAFIDTHAETQRVYVEGSEDADGYAEHYRSERLGSYPVWIDGSPGSFEVFKCAIVRGPGWQKDTLPAPPISTGISVEGFGRMSFDGCVRPD